jgi:preprotein translocase subunit SecG
MIIVLVLHILIAIFLVGLILVQKNEGGLGGLGGSGSGSGGMGGFLAGRTQANLLTRMTGGLAAAFFVTSLVLAIMSTHGGQTQLVPDVTAPAGTTPAAPAPAAPADAGSLNLEKGSTTAPTAPQPAAPQPAAPAGQ